MENSDGLGEVIVLVWLPHLRASRVWVLGGGRGFSGPPRLWGCWEPPLTPHSPQLLLLEETLEEL